MGVIFVRYVAAAGGGGGGSEVAFTQLTSGTAVATPATTASVSPTANRLQLLAVAVSTTSGANAPRDGAVSVSGGGLTWVQHGASVLYSSRRMVYLFRALGASPSTGALTITYTAAFGETFQEMSWSLAEAANVNTGGTNGSAAIDTATSGTQAGGTSVTATVSGTPVANDATYFLAGCEVDGAVTVEAGWDELSQVTHTNIRRLVTAKDAESDTTPSASWTGTNGAAMICARIIAA